MRTWNDGKDQVFTSLERYRCFVPSSGAHVRVVYYLWDWPYLPLGLHCFIIGHLAQLGCRVRFEDLWLECCHGLQKISVVVGEYA